MKVRIVCYEDPNAWILGKFARKLQSELSLLSINTDIAKVPDRKADVNHHIIYVDYDGKKNSIDTIMVTHVDSIDKIAKLSKQLINAEVAICMSKETKFKLIHGGLEPSKVCYINPAHDSVIKPRPFKIGITSKTHLDGRKNQNLVLKISKSINPSDFTFKIMGSGWDEIVNSLRQNGFIVDHFSKFDYNTYCKLMPTLDFFLYYSFDEGSMGYLDALTAGVKTIVTPQGYHLDANNGITYPIDGTPDNLIMVLNKIVEERNSRIQSVATWTWENYAKKHVEIWEYLLSGRSKNYHSSYNINLQEDGLNSIRNSVFIKQSKINVLKVWVKLGLTPIGFNYFLRGLFPSSIKKLLKKIKFFKNPN